MVTIPQKEAIAADFSLAAPNLIPDSIIFFSLLLIAFPAFYFFLQRTVRPGGAMRQWDAGTLIGSKNSASLIRLKFVPTTQSTYAAKSEHCPARLLMVVTTRNEVFSHRLALISVEEFTG
jgi:hypothetical protein